MDTSTPATRPPVSDAVPSTVTRLPWAMVDPEVGLLTVTVGGVVSVDFVLATRPEAMVVAGHPCRPGC